MYRVENDLLYCVLYCKNKLSQKLHLEKISHQIIANTYRNQWRDGNKGMSDIVYVAIIITILTSETFSCLVV